MEKFLTITCTVIALSAAGCGDDADSSEDAGVGQDASASNDASSATDTGMSGGGAGLLEASGTYKGTAFSMSCDLNNCSLTGMGDPCTLQCQQIQWFATCRPTPTKVGDIDLFQLWFNFPTADGTVGAHEYAGMSGGISIGNGGGQPLNSVAANAVSNTITVTTGGSSGDPISGSFSASWDDQGGEYGEVTGTFDFPCQ